MRGKDEINICMSALYDHAEHRENTWNSEPKQDNVEELLTGCAPPVEKRWKAWGKVTLTRAG